MKRHLLSFMLPLLALAACEKPFEEQEIPQSQTEPSLEFTATMEEIGAGTKTAIDVNKNIIWQAGDQIAVFQKNDINSQYQLAEGEGTTQGRFTHVQTPAGKEHPYGKFVAVYPYAEGNKLNSVTKEVIVNLPEIQHYVKDSYDPAAFPMVAISDNNVLSFKNVMGLMRLQVKGSATIKRITVSLNQDTKLHGESDISLNDQYKLTPSILSGKQVMECGDGVKLSQDALTDFYIAFPPIDLSEGFRVELEDMDNNVMELVAPANIAQNKIERNMILRMPEIIYKGQPRTEPVPAINEIVVKMPDAYATATPSDLGNMNNIEKVHVWGPYWKYVKTGGDFTTSGRLWVAGGFNFQKMILPEGLTKIDNEALYAMQGGNFTEIVLPSTLETIGYYAFQNNTILQKVTFAAPEKSNLKNIYDSAFSGAKALKSINIPKNANGETLSFGSEIFRDCKSLESISLPSNITAIADWMFHSSGLKQITFDPATKTFASMGAQAFLGTPLESIELPETKGEFVVPESAFDNCNQLTSVKLPQRTTRIGNQAFYNTTALKTINFPVGLKSIGIRSFYESGLTDVVLPNGVTMIEEFAFCYSKLQRLTIPSTTSYVENGFINVCGDLTELTILSGYNESLAISVDVSSLNCKKLTLTFNEDWKTNAPVANGYRPEIKENNGKFEYFWKGQQFAMIKFVKVDAEGNIIP